MHVSLNALLLLLLPVGLTACGGSSSESSLSSKATVPAIEAPESVQRNAKGQVGALPDRREWRFDVQAISSMEVLSFDDISHGIYKGAPGAGNCPVTPFEPGQPMVLSFTIEKDGTTSDFASSDAVGVDTADCLREVVAELRFPNTEAKTEVTAGLFVVDPEVYPNPRGYLERLSKEKTEMCACATQECAESLAGDHLAIRFYPAIGSPGVQVKTMSMQSDYRKCQQRLQPDEPAPASGMTTLGDVSCKSKDGILIVRRYLRRSKNKVLPCFKNESDPGARLKIQLDLDPSGGTAAKATGFQSASVITCVEKAMGSIRFPKFPAGEQCSVEIEVAAAEEGMMGR